MKSRNKIITLLNFLLAIIVAFSSCTTFKSNSSAPEYEIDLVCGMKVNKADAYTYKYEGRKYYFDNYNCKEAFKMNPKKFIENKCATK